VARQIQGYQLADEHDQAGWPGVSEATASRLDFPAACRAKKICEHGKYSITQIKY